ncbi:hypothetical protein ARMGADRAFT_1032439 [Armillaria gallica]|uniref:Uncharacterized protein n=1 Tax=Armillaria gallica TaxID=47427 RepID=A0A2H3DG26_ARMGA|nr:hypothetical protein ARMGADRAFT_1032439 [Armillaria gallica]
MSFITFHYSIESANDAYRSLPVIKGICVTVFEASSSAASILLELQHIVLHGDINLDFACSRSITTTPLPDRGKDLYFSTATTGIRLASGIKSPIQNTLMMRGLRLVKPPGVKKHHLDRFLCSEFETADSLEGEGSSWREMEAPIFGPLCPLLNILEPSYDSGYMGAVFCSDSRGRIKNFGPSRRPTDLPDFGQDQRKVSRRKPEDPYNLRSRTDRSKDEKDFIRMFLCYKRKKRLLLYGGLSFGNTYGSSLGSSYCRTRHRWQGILWRSEDLVALRLAWFKMIILVHWGPTTVSLLRLRSDRQLGTDDVKGDLLIGGQSNHRRHAFFWIFSMQVYSHRPLGAFAVATKYGQIYSHHPTSTDIVAMVTMEVVTGRSLPPAFMAPPFYYLGHQKNGTGQTVKRRKPVPIMSDDRLYWYSTGTIFALPLILHITVMVCSENSQNVTPPPTSPP